MCRKGVSTSEICMCSFCVCPLKTFLLFIHSTNFIEHLLCVRFWGCSSDQDVKISIFIDLTF